MSDFDDNVGQYRYEKSNRILEQAEKVIPLGTQTFSKSKIQFPVPLAPLYLERGQGSHVWDVDGNEYIDLVSGLLPITLGYCDPDVDSAILAQLKKGISFSLASSLELELAELMTELIPCAEMVRFGKNGTDATSAGVRLARAFTGKNHILALGYHGWQDWYIGSTTRNLGIPKEVGQFTTKVPFNDIESIITAYKSLDGDVAAIILEPFSAQVPNEGYLEFVREFATENNVVLIFDEVITGFRVHLGGAQAYYNVTPDLAAFGKGMGNGMPISAIVGRADIMSLMSEIFYSGTFGGETLSLAASIATINKMKTQNVIDHLWSIGKQVTHVTETAISENGLNDYVKLNGLDPWKILGFIDHPNAPKEAIKTKFMIEALKHGILVASAHNVSFAHDKNDVDHISNYYHKIFEKISFELNASILTDNLEVPIIYPVFQVRS